MDHHRPFVVLGCAIGALLLPAGASAANGDDPAGLSTYLSELATRDLRSASPAEQAEALGLPKSGSGSLLRDGGSLVVDLVVETPVREKLDGIEAAGGQVTAVSASDGMVEVSVPEGALRAVAAAPGVLTTNEVLTPMVGAVGEADPFAGAVNPCAPGIISEGDAQLRAALARSQFDVDGAGVKVGVLSDSYDTRPSGLNASDDVASGDLPGPGNPCGRSTPVQVLDDSAPQVPNTTKDEGRAMIQIVHDVAPGADLAFATAFTGDVSFATNIRALAAAGADVIVDDVIYTAEPYYQDSVIANAIRDVTNQGVTYFSMAFNNNRVAPVGGADINSWEATSYRTMACPAAVGGTSCMDFDPGAGSDNTFGYTTTGAGTPAFLLQWAEAQLGVVNDFSIYIVDGAGTVVASSVTNDLTSQVPFEGVTAPNSTTCSGALGCSVVIRRATGTGTPRIKWIQSDNGAGLISALEYSSANGDIIGPTIFGHNGTATAQTVGAVPFNNSATMEAFSSRGPVVHLFAPVNGSTAAAALATPEVLNKPDISATDGGRNTFFGSGCPTCRFSGTSAAAPHAAAVAALQLSAKPTATLAQIKAAQKTSGRPVGGFGPLAAGSGLIDAVDAVGLTISPPGVPSVTFGVGPGFSTNNPQPAVDFTVAGRPNLVVCSLDGGAAQACTSPFTPPSPLTDGSHDLVVGTADYFDQGATATASFTVDTVAPTTAFGKKPKKSSKKRKAKFTFSSTEADASFACKLDKARFSSCTSPAKFKVKLGKKHKLAVQAIDVAGNIGEVETYKWKTKKKRK